MMIERLEEIMYLALKNSPLHGLEAKILADEILRFRKEMTEANEIMDKYYSEIKYLKEKLSTT